MNLANLTVGEFQKLYAILMDTNLDPIDREVQIIALVEKKSVFDVEAMPIPLLKKKVAQYSDFSSLNMDKEKLPAWVMFKSKFGVRRYDVTLSESQMCSAQYIDLSHFMARKDGVIANMHHLFAVMLKRHRLFGKSKYDGSNHEKLATEIQEKLPIRMVYPLTLFFCNYTKASHEVIVNSLKSEKKKIMNSAVKALMTRVMEKEAMARRSRRVGAGSLHSTT